MNNSKIINNFPRCRLPICIHSDFSQAHLRLHYGWVVRLRLAMRSYWRTYYKLLSDVRNIVVKKARRERCFLFSLLMSVCNELCQVDLSVYCMLDYLFKMAKLASSKSGVPEGSRLIYFSSQYLSIAKGNSENYVFLYTPSQSQPLSTSKVQMLLMKNQKIHITSKCVPLHLRKALKVPSQVPFSFPPLPSSSISTAQPRKIMCFLVTQKSRVTSQRKCFLALLWSTFCVLDSIIASNESILSTLTNAVLAFDASLFLLRCVLCCAVRHTNTSIPHQSSMRECEANRIVIRSAERFQAQARSRRPNEEVIAILSHTTLNLLFDAGTVR